MPLEFPAGLGTDLAGVVDQVGERVASLAVGDEVLGAALPTRLPSRHSPIRSSSWCALPANGAGKRTLIRVLTTLLEQ
jgi:NADPH:quinone reductase-like Zn-dependent oxidoreductase